VDASHHTDTGTRSLVTKNVVNIDSSNTKVKLGKYSQVLPTLEKLLFLNND
jgi:hypothetical protein